MVRYMPQETLPLDDPVLAEPSLDLVRLAAHWAAYGARRPMTAEQMRGADRRAQRLGVKGRDLMEQAGAAVAVAARALLNSTDRPSSGVVLILCGPGNNGGDGFVAARHLATADISSVVVLVSVDERPGTSDAAANWDRARRAGTGRTDARGQRPRRLGAAQRPGARRARHRRAARHRRQRRAAGSHQRRGRLVHCGPTRRCPGARRRYADGTRPVDSDDRRSRTPAPT